jgi:outer membrane receptor protein involved in Fe transport
MKRFILILILVLHATISMAQNISGKVMDKESGLAIPYATVILKDSLGNFKQGISTNENGLFILESEKGRFTLEVTFIGYEKEMRHIEVVGEIKVDIILTPASAKLEEVTVVGEKTQIVQLIDKKVINVGKDLLAAGGDATTVLGQLAEVKVDINGNISLRGSQNVNVLLDGKPSPLSVSELLRQIPANQISKIEIITVPSAKYRASGLTGIINIITKTKINRGFTLGSSIDGNTLLGYGISTDLGYGGKNFYYKAKASHNKRIFENKYSDGRKGLAPYSQDGEFLFDGTVANVGAAVDWFASKKNEFSIGLDYTKNNHDLKNLVKILQNGNTKAQDNFSSHSHITQNYNLTYRHNFKTSEQHIDMDVRVSNTDNILTSSFISNELPNNAINNRATIYDAAIDYASPLSKKTNLETGFSWNKTDNKNLFNSLDSKGISSVNDFLNVETTSAIYGITTWMNSKWNIQTGLRAEFFERNADLKTTGQKVNITFNNLFPSVHLSYKIKETQTWMLGYNKRTSRPSLDQVLPTNIQQQQYTLYVGNPQLQPEFSHNLEISYQLNKPNFSISSTLAYRGKENIIGSYIFYNQDQVTRSSFRNIGESHAYGVDFSMNVKSVKGVSHLLSMNYNYEKFMNTAINFINDYGTNFTVRLSNEFTITSRMTANVNYSYNGLEKTAFDSFAENQKIDLGARYKFKLFNSRASINLRLTDVFNSLKYISQTNGDGFSLEGNFKPISRVLYLTASYNFENGSLLKKREKKERQYRSGTVN